MLRLNSRRLLARCAATQKLRLRQPLRSVQRRFISTGPSTSSAAAAAAAADTATPLILVQDTLSYLQSATGAPWWLTIGGAAIALRVVILPTVYLQVRETRQLLSLRPQLIKVREETESIASPNARVWERVSRMYALCRSHGVRPMRVVALPLAQIPFLLALVLAVRRMLLPDTPWADAMSHGGALWFTDLTRSDPTFALPVVSLLVILANFQLASSGSRSGLLYGARNVLQAGAVVALPFYAELPCGVFMYWIPNSCFSLIQTTLVRRFMPLPKPPMPQIAAATVPEAKIQQQQQQQIPAAAAAAEPANPAAAEEAAPIVEQSAEEIELRTHIAAEPLDVEAHVKLSKLLLRGKRPEDAVSHLWPAVKAAPQESSAPLRFQLGMAMALQEQHDVAEPLFEQVLQLEPEFAEAWLCLAATQEALGKADKAAETLDKVAELKPELADFVSKEKDRVRERAGGE